MIPSPPSSETLPLRARAVLVAAAVTFSLLMACAGRYGVFRDELYYVACGNHLAFGYVDHPPLVALMARVAQLFFGTSVVGLRLLPALCAAGMVVLAGELARTLGGKSFAQVLAAACSGFAPEMLGTHHILSMNCVLPLAWTAASILTVRALVYGEARAWVPFGLTCGVALLAKHSTLFFGASLAAGILVTPHRRALGTLRPWLGFAIAALLLAPNLAWEEVHGWPTLEFLHNAQTKKMVVMSPLEFAGALVMNFGPVTLPVWGGGVLWLLAAKSARSFRLLGVAFVTLFAILVLGHGKPYYMAGVFPAAYAAGGVAIESLVRRSGARAGILLAVGAAAIPIAPFALPILDPPAFVRYAAALGVTPRADEKHRLGSLPQFFADQFGWEKMAAQARDAYLSLTPEERAGAAFFGSNYGEAGAIDFFGAGWGLPAAASGHNAYFTWGPPRDGRGKVLITVGEDRDDVEEVYEDVREFGRTHDDYAMPYENDLPIYVCRKPRRTITEVWPGTKHFN